MGHILPLCGNLKNNKRIIILNFGTGLSKSFRSLFEVGAMGVALKSFLCCCFIGSVFSTIVDCHDMGA
jgi:hypothetical protein